MTIDTEIEVVGLEVLQEAMAQFDKKLHDKALYSASRAAITVIAKEARMQAPASEHAYRRYMSSGQGEKTFVMTRRGKMRKGKSKRAKRGEGRYRIQQAGLLRESIKVRKLKKQEMAKIGAESAYAIYIGKGKKQKFYPYYWSFVEFGTAKMLPIPFLRPSFDRQKQASINKFKSKLSANIEKIKGEIDG